MNNLPPITDDDLSKLEYAELLTLATSMATKIAQIEQAKQELAREKTALIKDFQDIQEVTNYLLDLYMEKELGSSVDEEIYLSVAEIHIQTFKMLRALAASPTSYPIGMCGALSNNLITEVYNLNTKYFKKVTITEAGDNTAAGKRNWGVLGEFERSVQRAFADQFNIDLGVDLAGLGVENSIFAKAYNMVGNLNIPLN